MAIMGNGRSVWLKEYMSVGVKIAGVGWAWWGAWKVGDEVVGTRCCNGTPTGQKMEALWAKKKHS